MTVAQEIILLKERFKLHIDDDMTSFLCNDKNTNINNIPIVIDGEEYIVGSFIKTDEEMNGSDLYKRYIMCPYETAEYLAFACGFDNDEFSIKVKGDDIGGIYHIDSPDEENIRIKKIFNTFCDFEQFIKREVK